MLWVIGYAVLFDTPTIEAPLRRVVLCKGHFESFVGHWRSRAWLCETRIVPVKRLRRRPQRFSCVARIFHDDAHAVTAIVIRQISHDPYTRMVHFNNRGNAFAVPSQSTGTSAGLGTGLPSNATTLKECPGNTKLRTSVALPFKT